MTSTIAKIKNGTITLPPEVIRAWSGRDVVILSDEDRVIIQRAKNPSLGIKQMMDQFQEAAQKTGLTQEDIDDAVQEVRHEMYNQS